MTVGVFEFYHNFHWIGPGVGETSGVFFMFSCDYTSFQEKCCILLVLFLDWTPPPTYANNLKITHFWVSLKFRLKIVFLILTNFHIKARDFFLSKINIFSSKTIGTPFVFFGIDVSRIRDLYFGLSQDVFLLKTLLQLTFLFLSQFLILA